MSALGHKRTFRSAIAMSALPPKADIPRDQQNFCFVPCVDGSELARTFFTFCSLGRCSHVFGL